MTGLPRWACALLAMAEAWPRWYDIGNYLREDEFAMKKLAGVLVLLTLLTTFAAFNNVNPPTDGAYENPELLCDGTGEYELIGTRGGGAPPCPPEPD